MRKIYCYILPERLDKTNRIIGSFAQGCGGQMVYDMDFLPDPGNAVVVWGQVFSSAEIMKKCVRRGIDFYQVDNGYFNGARGKVGRGTYRVTKNALVQNRIIQRPPDRWLAQNLQLKPWRTEGKTLVLAVPGQNYGRYLDLDLHQWEIDTHHLLSMLTKRKIHVRPKVKEPTIQDFLNGNNVHALVTHSSNAAVEAAVEGYPVFCHPECAAAPVGNLDLAAIERPVMPDRGPWAYSLAYCQFTIEEFQDGTAWRILQENDGL